MADIICKLPNGKFLLWSTIVDAPIIKGMKREEFNNFMRGRYGSLYMETDHIGRMERADKCGTSSIGHENFEDVIFINRAGENEEQLTLDEIVKKYGGDD